VALWYRRRFNLPLGDAPALHPDALSRGVRYFLNFEAVDYEAAVMRERGVVFVC
jgi:hypothetical protein